MTQDGFEYVNDDGTKLVNGAYSKAIDRMVHYMGRGYWKAAERWASIAWSLGESLDEIAFGLGDREDA
jgi:hypothetical protein